MRGAIFASSMRCLSASVARIERKRNPGGSWSQPVLILPGRSGLPLIRVAGRPATDEECVAVGFGKPPADVDLALRHPDDIQRRVVALVCLVQGRELRL